MDGGWAEWQKVKMRKKERKRCTQNKSVDMLSRYKQDWLRYSAPVSRKINRSERKKKFDNTHTHAQKKREKMQ